MAWIKKFIFDNTTGVSYDYHIIEKIGLPAWDKTVGAAGWGGGTVSIASYVSSEARLAGFGPISRSTFVIDFMIFGTIDWNGQDNLLTWAYNSLKAYMVGPMDLTDAESDVGPPGDPYPIDAKDLV